MDFLKKFPSYEYLLQNGAKAFTRFPFALINAFYGTAVAVYLIEKSFDGKQCLLADKLIMVVALGMPLFVALTCLAEKMEWKKGKSLLLQAVGAVALVIYFFSLPADISSRLMDIIRFILLAIGLHFLVAFLPFVGGKQVAGFWHFNKSLFLRFLQIGLYSGVMYFGLAIALGAADYLFGIDVDERRYFELWVILAGIFQSWVFLSEVPDKYDVDESLIKYPKALKVFTQYILLPLVGLYFVILIAYEAKIIVEWNWPKGWVSQLVLWYSVVGILSLLLLHPLREKSENSWIKVFSKWFFWALVPLVVMLMLAILVRISDYGITENRYFVLALAIGLSITVLYFIFSRSKDIRIIPIILCLLAFFSAYGPWSAFAVSQNSQMNRLHTLLSQNELLTNGKIAKTQNNIPFEDKKEISSIVEYVASHYGLEPFSDIYTDSILAGISDTLSPYKKINLLVEQMGFEYIASWAQDNQETHFYLSAENYYIADIRGYDYLQLLKDDQILDSGQDCVVNSRLYVISLNKDSLIWQMDIYEDTTRENLLEAVTLPMPKEISQYSHSSTSKALPVEKMTLKLNGKSANTKIIFNNLYGYSNNDSLTITGFEGILLLKEKH